MGNRTFGRSRVVHAFASIVLGMSALAAYGGCSSSTPSDGTPDAGGGKDTSTPDTNLAPPDAAPDDAGAEDTGADVAIDATPAGCEDAGDGLPNTLECTGLYSDWETKTVATSVRQYLPGYQLWSDGAIKTRFVYLPPGTKIDTTDMDEWTFPVGTKVWKEFRLGAERIETRLFQKTENDWVWTTYRWTKDEKTATKLDGGEQNVNGTTYEIPSHSQCFQCHQGRKDRLLGFDAISLAASGATGVTLTTLSAQGWLTTAAPASLVIPEDTSGNARPALGWLHANCGAACHNHVGLAKGTGLFLKVDAKQIIAGAGAVTVKELEPYTTSVNVVPNLTTFAQQGYRRITPRDVSKSLIPLLDGSRGDPNVPQMPPLVSHVSDPTGLGYVTTWITTMPLPDAGN